MKTRYKRQNNGFSLIEMMIVVAVIAILAAIALPSYFDYIRKSRRSEGLDALLHIQTQQEKWRASHTSYTQNLTTAAPNGLALSSSTGEGYYNLAITALSATATGYIATATAQGDQANDDEDGVGCGTLTLTVSAANPRGQKTPTQCWN